jgi:hypothetical protein
MQSVYGLSLGSVLLLAARDWPSHSASWASSTWRTADGDDRGLRDFMVQQAIRDAAPGRSAPAC